MSEQPKFVVLFSDGEPRKLGVIPIEQIANMVQEAYTTELQNDKSGRFSSAFVQGAVSAVRLRKRICERFLAEYESTTAGMETVMQVESKPASEHKAMNTYFIYSPKLEAVKIGKSVDPEKRLRTIKNGNPDELRLLGVINDDKEKELHDRFAEYRTKGEWFSLGSRLLAFLKAEFGLISEQLP